MHSPRPGWFQWMGMTSVVGLSERRSSGRMFWYILLVGGLEHWNFEWLSRTFHISWECHHPNWLVIFSEGLKPPTSLHLLGYESMMKPSSMLEIFGRGSPSGQCWTCRKPLSLEIWKRRRFDARFCGSIWSSILCQAWVCLSCFIPWSTLWWTNITNWTITMLLMGKFTTFLWWCSTSQTVSHVIPRPFFFWVSTIAGAGHGCSSIHIVSLGPAGTLARCNWMLAIAARRSPARPS